MRARRATHGAELLTPAEAAALVPIINPDGLHGALFDPDEGNLDPVGAVMAYATAAKARGVEIVQGNRVTALARRPDGGWTVATEQGDIGCEHVVNAAGLWARRVGRMAGVDHPVAPLRAPLPGHRRDPGRRGAGRPDGGGHRPRGLHLPPARGQRRAAGRVRDAPGATGRSRARPGTSGCSSCPRTSTASRRSSSSPSGASPSSAETGIKRWVCGPFTATPDGNPLVGPVDGLPGYWAACGVFAGFSPVRGRRPRARPTGSWTAIPAWMPSGWTWRATARSRASDGYLRATTAQFYARRFVIAYPNEELPAGRPLQDDARLRRARGGGGAPQRQLGPRGRALSVATDPGFEEAATFGRSERRAASSRPRSAAVRTAAGVFEIAQYARYEVSGPGAAAWLDGLRRGPPARARADPPGADAGPDRAPHGRPVAWRAWRRTASG